MTITNDAAIVYIRVVLSLIAPFANKSLVAARLFVYLKFIRSLQIFKITLGGRLHLLENFATIILKIAFMFVSEVMFVSRKM